MASIIAQQLQFWSGFFGLGSTATSGKWRSVLLLSFITFILMNAALEDEEWVAGGIEYTFNPPTAGLTSLPFRKFMPSPPAGTKLAHEERKAGGAGHFSADVGATRLQQRFTLGLDVLTLSNDFVYDYTNERGNFRSVLDLLPFLRQAVAATNAGDTEYGRIATLDGTKITAVKGLLGTAIFAAAVMWLGLLALSYDIIYPRYVTFTHSAIKVAGPTATFFAFVAVCAFDGSKAKVDFCSALDPDADSDGLPCVYSNGFNVALASIFIAAIASAALFRWLPWHDIGDTSAPSKAAADGMPDVGGSSSSTVPVASEGGFQVLPLRATGGYQGFGN